MPANHWQRLADAVDLKQWTSSPAGESLHESPLIRTFQAFVPDGVCSWLVDFSRGLLTRALVYDPIGGRDIASRNRTNSWAQFDLMSSELIHLLVQLRMQAACGLPLWNMEATAVLHYAVGEESINHFDFVSPEIPGYDEEIARNGQRVLTFLVYLNDDYEGGRTDFPELGFATRARRARDCSSSTRWKTTRLTFAPCMRDARPRGVKSGSSRSSSAVAGCSVSRP